MKKRNGASIIILTLLLAMCVLAVAPTLNSADSAYAGQQDGLEGSGAYQGNAMEPGVYLSDATESSVYLSDTVESGAQQDNTMESSAYLGNESQSDAQQPSSGISAGNAPDMSDLFEESDEFDMDAWLGDFDPDAYFGTFDESFLSGPGEVSIAVIDTLGEYVGGIEILENGFRTGIISIEGGPVLLTEVPYGFRNYKIVVPYSCDFIGVNVSKTAANTGDGDEGDGTANDVQSGSNGGGRQGADEGQGGTVEGQNGTGEDSRWGADEGQGGTVEGQSGADEESWQSGDGSAGVMESADVEITDGFYKWDIVFTIRHNGKARFSYYHVSPNNRFYNIPVIESIEPIESIEVIETIAHQENAEGLETSEIASRQPSEIAPRQPSEIASRRSLGRKHILNTFSGASVHIAVMADIPLIKGAKSIRLIRSGSSGEGHSGVGRISDWGILAESGEYSMPDWTFTTGVKQLTADVATLPESGRTGRIFFIATLDSAYEGASFWIEGIELVMADGSLNENKDPDNPSVSIQIVDLPSLQ